MCHPKSLLNATAHPGCGRIRTRCGRVDSAPVARRVSPHPRAVARPSHVPLPSAPSASAPSTPARPSSGIVRDPVPPTRSCRPCHERCLGDLAEMFPSGRPSFHTTRPVIERRAKRRGYVDSEWDGEVDDARVRRPPAPPLPAIRPGGTLVAALGNKTREMTATRAYFTRAFGCRRSHIRAGHDVRPRLATRAIGKPLGPPLPRARAATSTTGATRVTATADGAAPAARARGAYHHGTPLQHL